MPHIPQPLNYELMQLKTYASSSCIQLQFKLYEGLLKLHQMETSLFHATMSLLKVGLARF